MATGLIPNYFKVNGDFLQSTLTEPIEVEVEIDGAATLVDGYLVRLYYLLEIYVTK